MTVINTTITNPTMACKDVIGVRGLCNNTTPYLLDSLGISLNKASKLADSSMITGRQLIDESIESAWSDVFSDLRINGFMVNGVRKIFKSELLDTLTNVVTYTVELSRTCDIENIYLNSVKLKSDGEVNLVLSLIYNGMENVLYNDTLEDETLTVNLDSIINADSVVIKVVATGSGSLYQSNNGVISYNGYTECSESIFYCKYWNILVKAVMYKAAAHILNSSLFSDRYNDFVVYKKDEIALRVSQLDSTFNLLTQVGNTVTGNGKGLYQLEIIKINDKLKQIVKQSYCTCCFECDNVISSRITIP